MIGSSQTFLLGYSTLEGLIPHSINFGDSFLNNISLPCHCDKEIHESDLIENFEV